MFVHLGVVTIQKSEFFQDISMNGKAITDLKAPTMELDVATKQYVDDKLIAPTLDPEIATKSYVDTKGAALSGIDARLLLLLYSFIKIDLTGCRQCTLKHA